MHPTGQSPVRWVSCGLRSRVFCQGRHAIAYLELGASCGHEPLRRSLQACTGRQQHSLRDAGITIGFVIGELIIVLSPVSSTAVKLCWVRRQTLAGYGAACPPHCFQQQCCVSIAVCIADGGQSCVP